MNEKRNISARLSDEEQMLYEYSQNVTSKLLEEMRAKYEQAEKSEGNEEQQEEVLQLLRG